MRDHDLRGVSWKAGRARPEAGAAAVEFALVLPILMMLLFGIITSGMSYTHAIGLTNAVREGARFGATADTSSGTWAADVIARVRATQFDDSTSPSSSSTAICARLMTAPSTLSGTAGTSACSTGPNSPALDATSAPSLAGIKAGTCVVEVWAARPFQISILVAPAWNETVHRTSVATYERTGC